MPKKELDEMFEKAKEIGIDVYGGSRQGMYLVVHDNCKYPISTDASVMGPRNDFPGPIMGDIEVPMRMLTCMRKRAGEKARERESERVGWVGRMGAGRWSGGPSARAGSISIATAEHNACARVSPLYPGHNGRYKCKRCA